MDLVWGPELKFSESQSQVYKFLGAEKYQPVLTSIYAGLGIPCPLQELLLAVDIQTTMFHSKH